MSYRKCYDKLGVARVIARIGIASPLSIPGQSPLQYWTNGPMSLPMSSVCLLRSCRHVLATNNKLDQETHRRREVSDCWHHPIRLKQFFVFLILPHNGKDERSKVSIQLQVDTKRSFPA